MSKDIQAGLDRIDRPERLQGHPGWRGPELRTSRSGRSSTALGLSVLLMYMLMVALFESLIYPLMIMFSLPLAVVGAFGLLALTGNTLNMMSMIGMILLTGLVGKNAILLVDYTNTLRKRGLGAQRRAAAGWSNPAAADPDDHLGAGAGDVADRPQAGRGQRVARADGGHRDRWSADLDPADAGADPGGVHDHGRLHGLAVARATVDRPLRDDASNAPRTRARTPVEPEPPRVPVPVGAD